MVTFSPTSLDEWSEVVRQAKVVSSFDTSPYQTFFSSRAPQHEAVTVNLDRWSGVEAHDVEDQVMVAKSGTTIRELQFVLAEKGQCIPYAGASVHPIFTEPCYQATLHDLIAFNLPHALEAQCGSWRDWILGMTVVLADGTVAKCGSKAVKNVAGYDVQRLVIGSRASLALTTSVILKTFPIRALPLPDVFPGIYEPGKPWLVQRTLASDFNDSCQPGGLILADSASSTVWRTVVPGSLKRFDEDWVISSQFGNDILTISNETKRTLMKRTKQIFDPSQKLNPGVFDFL
jgi:FAD binding domain